MFICWEDVSFAGPRDRWLKAERAGEERPRLVSFRAEREISLCKYRNCEIPRRQRLLGMTGYSSVLSG